MRDEVIIAVADIAPGRVDGWASYPLGALWAMGQAGVAVPGLDIVIDSEIPLGAGLGSSAAFEVALALARRRAQRAGSSSHDELRALLPGGRAVRGRTRRPASWTSSPSSMAGPGMRCSSIAAASPASWCPSRADDASATVLVIDTTVVHGTSGAGYRARREQSAQAAAALGVHSLRDATLDDVESRFTGVLQRRARHVVTENDRVAHTVRAAAQRGPAGHRGVAGREPRLAAR